ncbi:esterase [Cupriavidus sp. WGtm5]|uniref:esterase n=1 Tax=Cupriavidus sp. WGtm5 TaxID=2919926 RepID=UPI0020916999|nr:esterase [Cupriavidus sp. WGtm5]MCO4893526.1 esterase [Cupriavidus sp. WGtm5]
MFTDTSVDASRLIALRAVRGFHVGGRPVDLVDLPHRHVATVPGVQPRVSNPNGRYQVGQLYVQQFDLAAPTAKYPLLMWHGGGMTGATWECTPDGRPGWHDFFMRKGYDTFVSDAVERGRASWAPAYVVSEMPEHRTLEQAWDIFRFGPMAGYDAANAKRQAFAGQRFPIHALDELAKQFVARWTSTAGMALDAYVELIRRVGPCVILAHSEGGRLAQYAALSVPELVRGLILIEPAGAPSTTVDDASRLRGIPHCVLWGDYIAQNALWTIYRRQVDEWLSALRQAGAGVTEFDLPAMGIRGNSHLPMMDDNNLLVAGLVHDWIHRAVVGDGPAQRTWRRLSPA